MNQFRSREAGSGEKIAQKERRDSDLTGKRALRPMMQTHQGWSQPVTYFQLMHGSCSRGNLQSIAAFFGIDESPDPRIGKRRRAISWSAWLGVAGFLSAELAARVVLAHPESNAALIAAGALALPSFLLLSAGTGPRLIGCPDDREDRLAPPARGARTPQNDAHASWGKSAFPFR